MIGIPMPNPRDSIIANLNQQLEQYFGTGKPVQESAPGITAEKAAMFGTSHSNKLRVECDKLAPRLKELAEAGKTVIEAAKEMGMESQRAGLIARENNIKLPGPPLKRLSNQVRQCRRQTWLDIPAHGIEETGHGQEQRGYSEGQARQGESAAGSDRRREAHADCIEGAY